MAEARLRPVERPGVAAIVTQQAGDGVQRRAHGAPRRRSQPSQVHGEGVMFLRDVLGEGKLMRRRVVVSG